MIKNKACLTFDILEGNIWSCDHMFPSYDHMYKRDFYRQILDETSVLSHPLALPPSPSPLLLVQAERLGEVLNSLWKEDFPWARFKQLATDVFQNAFQIYGYGEKMQIFMLS